MDNYTISSNSLEKFYSINGDHFGQQYKKHLSDYNQWNQKDYADQQVLYPDNIGSTLSLDKTSLSNRELYSILTNKAAKGRRGILVAMIKGNRSTNASTESFNAKLRGFSTALRGVTDTRFFLYRVAKIFA